MAAKPKPKLNPEPSKQLCVDRASTVFYLAAALIALAGLADATYLTVQALRGETLTCGGSPACFRVLGRAYARIGDLPVAGFGAAVYFSAFGCAVFTIFGSARAGRCFALVVAAMPLATLWFLFAQAFVLHAFYRYGLLSAAATFLLAGIAISLPRPLDRPA